ncbi:hypothetical protein [Aquimarina aquimarini]|uniref:hypothetical protein n=1 Tax=Aquimarina aquimarini TaxID=1191734 RepID=UPI000D55524C|nr:hypothetical protein [Aquimarina aquimarini]
MKTTGVNNYVLGVSSVFDTSQVQNYLKFRFGQWDLKAPFDFSPKLSELPPVVSTEELPEIETLGEELQKEIRYRKSCIESNIDFYFPLQEKEKVEKDILTIIKEEAKGCPAGTVIWIRKTNLAEYFALAGDWQFDVTKPKLTSRVVKNTSLETPKLKRPVVLRDDIKAVTTVLDVFAEMIPGPANYGIKLLSFALGQAGSSSGPSWDEIYGMVRTIVREELIAEGLRTIQANFSALTDWSNDHYLPQKNKKRVKNAKLQELLEPQMKPMLDDLNKLITTEYRISGFVLLLQGVNMYLTMLQEKISIDAPADVRGAANTWSARMLEVWGEVKEERKNKIVVKRFSYAVPVGHDAVTQYYYAYIDEHTGEKFGSRNGPWQESKGGEAKDGATKAAEKHWEEVLATMKKDLADPDNTARKWKNILVPSKMLQDNL